jgi:NAD(P)-dependent dehydrogenase (short-subunit alcohol dehydrogenase family)
VFNVSGEATQMRTLEGQVVAVVGGSSGMGRQTAQHLASLGASVVIGARRLELCEELVETIRRDGGDASAVGIDATDPESVRQFFDVLQANHGRLDGAFNNVGRTLGHSPTIDTPLERFEQTLAFNLKSTFLCMQQELRLMSAAGRGSIVNNSSIGGTRGFAGLQDYCAAKWGVIGLTKSAALETAAQGIRINVIAPGLVATERFELIRSQQSALLESRIKEIPMARPAHMHEVAETVAWLLGPNCGFLTGAVIPLDGGECAA